MTSTPPTAPVDQPPVGPPPADAAQGPRVTRDEVRDLGRIRRTVGRDRKLAGVAGGLARHLDIDPVLLRVAFVVLVFFGGAGSCSTRPAGCSSPRTARAPTQPGRAQPRLRADRGRRGLALLVLGDSVGQFGFPWPLARWRWSPCWS